MKVATLNYGKLSNTKLSLVDGIFNVTLQGEDLTDGKPGQVYKVAVE